MATLLSLFAASHYYTVDDPLRLHVNASNRGLLQKVVQHSPEIEEMIFRPSYLFQNSHMNTFLTGLSTRYNNYMQLSLKHRKEIFRLSDGGEIVLMHREREDPLDDSNNKKTESRSQDDLRPLIIIVPGLMSTIDDHHLHTLLGQAQDSGYDWVLINYRGI